MGSEHMGERNNIFCGIDISKLPQIGEGRQGWVYQISENKVIKVYKKRNSCINQLYILQQVEGSKYFSKIYEYNKNSIIMEFIEGISMNRFLKFNKLNKRIALELVELIDEFKYLGFIRLDIRISHIFIQKDESIRIIDPRGCFKIPQPFPFLMLRGLREFNSLDDFFEFIKDDNPKVYLDWKEKWNDSARRVNKMK